MLLKLTKKGEEPEPWVIGRIYILKSNPNQLSVLNWSTEKRRRGKKPWRLEIKQDENT